jgi:LacI family transcriptional regulator
MPRQRSNSMITVRDIARESGFSIATVSIVLNEAPLAQYVSAPTKKKIKTVAERLGYRPNQFARSLRGSRSRSVGLMVFDVTDPFCTPVIQGIEEKLFEASYLSIFADAHNDTARFVRYLEMMLERRVEGLIVVAGWLVIDINLLSDLRKHSIPTVIVGREFQHDSVSSVIVDNEAGGRMAIEHLYSLGHREFAFIRGARPMTDAELRWKGIRAFARSVDLPLRRDLVLDLPDRFDPNHGYEQAQKLTLELLKTGRKFTAIVAYDDVTALGAIRALSSSGIRVPEQCSVIGFDDVAPASFAAPSLTTIRQPMGTMGTTAVEIVAKANSSANGNFTNIRQKLSPELVVRQSTAPCQER